MKRMPMVVLAVLGGACGVTHEEYEAALAEAERNAAERDSLVAEVLATASLVNQINVELAQVSDSSLTLSLATEGALDSAAEANVVALSKIQTAIRQLQESQTEIERNRARIEELSTSESRLSRTVARYETTIAEVRAAAERREAELTAIIDEQRAQIRTLAMEVDTVRAENEVLSVENAVLADSLEILADAATTVYYAIGTKRELEDLGIVVNEGKKFLFFGSKTLQPARELNPDDFTAIDKHMVTEIPLPRADKDYKILTRHNTSVLASNVSDDGKVREVLTISSPEEFWAASRFLILVEQ